MGAALAWLVRRLPLWLALAATFYVAAEVDIAQDPDLPLIDSWLESATKQDVALMLLLALVFILVLLLASVAWRFVLQATPNRLKGPLGIELDWTPEVARQVKGADDALQREIEATVALVKRIDERLTTLERARVG